MLLRWRKLHNWRFLRRTKRQSFSYSGRALDVQQIEAVVACEDAQLVLASAGSGKTLSLLAKIEYLHVRLNIPAEQILVISFTQKTVAELKERCKITGVEIRTFHGLGNKLLRSMQSPAISAKRLIADDAIGRFIRDYCESLIAHDSHFARAFVDFVLFFYPISADSMRPQKEQARDERRISDWLRLHGLSFERSCQYPFSDHKYLVSFTIRAPQIIYIDYLIVDQKGQSIYGADYLRDAKWRAELQAQNATDYIVLPSWRWRNNTLFPHLKNELQKYNIPLRRVPSAEAYALIAKDELHSKDLDAFYRMLQTILLLHKNGMYSLSGIAERLRTEDEYYAKRNQLFQFVYLRVYSAYERFLFKTRQYDFADMINAAKRQVEEAPDCARGYKYILLDEVQDLSRNRLLLIREILRKNPSCKLFAVGDDWQSIYRFAGSDLALIRDFEQIFGLTTRRSLIESTHRFGQPTIRLSCEFIQRNPAQSRKMVKNIQKTTTPIYIIFNRPNRRKTGQDAESLHVVLRGIVAALGYNSAREKTIQIISRYNHDIARLESERFKIAPRADNAEVFDVVWLGDSCEELRLEFCSMHKSKGITRDIVIILNMNAGLGGMPALRESDPIIDSLLAENEPYPFAEERRLFYVAITRAREATYLIANGKNPSPFIQEILGDDYLKTAEML